MLSKLPRANSQQVVKVALDSRIDALNHHSVLAPINWAYKWMSTSIVDGMMKMKTKILSRLTHSFCWVLYALSCSFIHWASHAFLSQPTAWNGGNLISEAFPSRVTPHPPIPCIRAPTESQETAMKIYMLYPPVSVSTILCYPLALPAWTLVLACYLATRSLLFGFCYSLHPFGFPLTPLQTVLAHVAFVITTVVGCPSFFCNPLLGCCL